jgi:hypothetical protein
MQLVVTREEKYISEVHVLSKNALPALPIHTHASYDRPIAS